MKAKIMSTLISGIVVSGFAVVAGAEEIKVEITDISVEDNMYTPYYNVETVLDHQQGASQTWIQLHVEYTSEGGWIDELSIVQSALVYREDKSPVVIDEEVTYINVKPGDHYANVYIHPRLVERYGVDANEVDTAAIIRIGDREVARAETTKEAKEGWSTNRKAIPHKGHLLNHTQTPFWFINYDFKEIIKRDAHAHGEAKKSVKDG